VAQAIPVVTIEEDFACLSVKKQIKKLNNTKPSLTTEKHEKYAMRRSWRIPNAWSARAPCYVPFDHMAQHD
jgi:hypothetical protein